MIFLGCLFDRKNEEYYLKKSPRGLSNAAGAFQWACIDGFILNGEKLKIVNVLPVGTYPKAYKDLILKDRIWEYNGEKHYEVGSINLPFFKQAQRARKIKKFLKNQSDKNIVIYSAYAPFLKAVYKLKKDYIVTLIVTDIPEYYDLQKTSFLRRFLRKLNNKKVYKYLKRIDKFVLLTEQMKDALSVNDRPYTVVEGIYSSNNEVSAEKSNKKAILYTGTLMKKFGISNLLTAFDGIDGDDIELWICGSGEAEEEIKKLAKVDARIKFLGFVKREEALKLQKQATILVNPRQDKGVYTKYSFPSKTMEYLASGTPLVAYKLAGTPDEYDKHIFYVNGDTANDLKDTLVKVLTKSDAERTEFGQNAREFILNNKNAKTQTKKIIEL